MKRVLDDLHRNNDEHRRLLLELEEIVNLRQRSPPVRRRKVESDVTVHVSRIPSDYSVGELVDQFVEMYGAVKSSYSGKGWANIEFLTAESQRKCLDDEAFLNKQFGIIVAKHITKR